MKRRSDNLSGCPRFPAVFTLLLFFAYLVYMPVHVATEAHCLFPANSDLCLTADHQHTHEGDHHEHGSPCEEKSRCADDHQHHSLEEHELDYTSKDGSLKLLVATQVVIFDNGLFRPNLIKVGIIGLPTDIPDRTSGPPLPARAPPLV